MCGRVWPLMGDRVAFKVKCYTKQTLQHVVHVLLVRDIHVVDIEGFKYCILPPFQKFQAFQLIVLGRLGSEDSTHGQHVITGQNAKKFKALHKFAYIGAKTSALFLCLAAIHTSVYARHSTTTRNGKLTGHSLR